MGEGCSLGTRRKRRLRRGAHDIKAKHVNSVCRTCIGRGVVREIDSSITVTWQIMLSCAALVSCNGLGAARRCSAPWDGIQRVATPCGEKAFATS